MDYCGDGQFLAQMFPSAQQSMAIFSTTSVTLETATTNAFLYGQEVPHSHSLLGSWCIPGITTGKEVQGLKASQEDWCIPDASLI